MLLFLSAFDEDDIFFCQRNSIRTESKRQGDEEPPVRLGGFSFYTRLLLRLLLLWELELVEELSEESSSSPNFSHGVKQS